MPSMNSLIWKPLNKEIKDLKSLLKVLINIKQEDVDNEINLNLKNLTKWLEENFPRQVEIVVSIEKEGFTPQQIREKIIRILKA